MVEWGIGTGFRRRNADYLPISVKAESQRSKELAMDRRHLKVRVVRVVHELFVQNHDSLFLGTLK